MKTVSVFYDPNHPETDIPVEKKEDADFIRAVISPDKTDNGLYNINDYYLSGKLKAIGKSKSSNYDVKLEGQSIEFFENGHKKRICTFHDGMLMGDIIDYFSNGRINTTKTIVEDLDSLEKKR
jgi:antitoxin component YwqK of YwqJK toxin-antitoxin module